MTISLGHTSSSVPGVTELSTAIAPFNFDEDFVSSPSSDGSSLVYTSITSPVDQPFTIRYTKRTRRNVYSGYELAVANQLPSSRGDDLVVAVKMLAKTTEGDIFIPLYGTMTLTVPPTSLVSDGEASQLVEILYAAVAEQGSTGVIEGLGRFRRGVLAR